MIRGLEYLRLKHLRRAHQGVPEVPPVDTEVVVDPLYPGYGGTSPPLPIVLHLVHELARPEQRERGLPPARCVAQLLLELADQELQVERQTPVAVIVGIPEELLPAHLAGDDRWPREVGVVDGPALEAVRQRVSYGDKPVARPAFGLLVHLNTQGWILYRFARGVGDLDLVRRIRIEHAIGEFFSH